MFQENLLENIKIETIPVNASHWLLKTDVCFRCFRSVPDAKIELTLKTERNILRKKQSCCNDVCDQEEMHTAVELFVPKVVS